MATTTARDALRRRALRLEYATIAWNLGEAVLTIWLGLAAGSLALVGFGTDSVIEVFASGVVVWHVRPGHQIDRPDRTALALNLVAGAFLALALILAAASIRNLAGGQRAGHSLAGITYLAVTALVMFGLAVAKRRTAAGLGSAPLASEASMTFLDGMLSTATLAGLALNAGLGWWWADPAAALLVSIAALNEAHENRGEARDLQRSAGKAGPDR